MNGIQAFLDLLAGSDVKYLFGNPGTTELPLNDALVTDQRIQYILGLQEVPVMAMADGYAMASRRGGTVGPPDSGKRVPTIHHPRAASVCWQDRAPQQSFSPPGSVLIRILMRFLDPPPLPRLPNGLAICFGQAMVFTCLPLVFLDQLMAHEGRTRVGDDR